MKHPHQISIALAALIAFILRSPAAPGNLDLNFDPGSVNGVGGSLRAAIPLSNGTIIAVGGFSTVRGVPRHGVARLNADGTLDNAFDAGVGPDNYFLDSAAVQPDGKVLIGGTFSSFSGFSSWSLVRLHEDGSVDQSFTPSPGGGYRANVIAIQPDGKVLVGVDSYLARLNTDASYDTNFNYVSTGTALCCANILALAVQPDGKILIGGDFTSEYINGVEHDQGYIARLNSDGSWDTTFVVGLNDYVYSIVLQGDGRILLGGWFTTINGTNRNGIARLNANGTLDTTFNPSGGATGGYPYVNSIALQTDGKVLALGAFSTMNGANRNGIARLNANGTLDTTFNPGSAFNGYYVPGAIAVQTDGKVLVAGNLSSFNGVGHNGIVRLNANGSVDTGFDPPSGPNDRLSSLATQKDGKVIIGGSFTSIHGTNRNRIARLNGSGGLDTTFNPGSGANDYVASTAVQADGKVLVSGNFTIVNGFSRNHIARLNTNGILDVTFNPGTGANTNVYDVAVQSDGKVVMLGPFTAVNGTPRKYVARLNANGSLDTTFDPGTGPDSFPYCLATPSDGRILIGGSFTTIAGIARRNLARLNPDGSVDMDFDPVNGPNASGIYSLAAQSDGKVLVGGCFTAFNGSPRNGIARVNGDGSVDGAFVPLTPSDCCVQAIAVQPDGKPLLAVIITNWYGILRLNTDGAPDAAFHLPSAVNPTTGAGIVWSLGIQTDGRILMGGAFSAIDGVQRAYVARLYGTSPVIFRNDGILASQFGFNVSGDLNQVIVLEASRDLLNWSPFATNTLGDAALRFNDPAAPTLPQKFYRARLK